MHPQGASTQLTILLYNNFAEVPRFILQTGWQMNNPFTFGNPISDPIRFIGRKHEIDQIYSRLLNAEAESSSIVGERRIGKTSLLHYLSHPITRTHYGVDQEKFVFTYSDLEIVDSHTTPIRLLQRLLRQVLVQVSDPEVKQAIEDVRRLDVFDNFALADLFDVIDTKGFHIVLLLDEFERVTSNPNFDPNFFYGLRSLAIQHNLTLITSSRRELIDLTHSEEIRSSPFFNIFANINVGLFTKGETMQLIQTALNGTDVSFTDGEIDFIIRLSGNHPFFTQVASSFLFSAYQQNLSGPERKKYTESNFCSQVTPHLGDYWRNSPDNEKIVMASMALLEKHGKAVKFSVSLKQLQELFSRSEQPVARLEKRCLIYRSDDRFSLINPLLGDWILSELRDTMRDKVTFDDWVKTNQNGPINRISKEARQQLDQILPKIGASYRDLIISWVSDPQNLKPVASMLAGLIGSTF